MELTRLSPSSLSSFEREGACLRKWQGMWLDYEFRLEPTKPMVLGSFFEYLCLGDDAFEDPVKEIPRKSNGEQYVHEERIRQQADRFKKMFDVGEFMFDDIGEKQLKIVHSNEVDRGVIDFITVDEWSGKKYLWDLKLTSSVYATHHPKMWGNPAESLDLIQGCWYPYLYKDKYNEEVESTRYLIFDYSTAMGVKYIEVFPDNKKLDEVLKRKEKLKETIRDYEELPRIPSKDECSNCPLKCSVRYEGE